ncbi:MAG: nucleoside triphosphate pyrophosphohydrolase, partial [Actinobacteria bacterium]|nr:nucleoside triphosphate pyrophosphohydrolase [Actinomycetota bacterium]
ALPILVFHARIAAEDTDDPWTIDDVADGIVSKLVSRHPHVFGDVTADTPEQVEANWHALKAKEKGRESVTDGIPAALPALVHAGKVLSRSATLGERLPGLPEQASAEAAMADLGAEADFGDLLLALVAVGRARGFDAESALRMAARRRIAVIRTAEGLA